MRLAGAVLVGGRSSRMGTDKALMEVEGVPMAARVATALADGGCEPVVLVGGEAATYGRLGLPVVPDLFGAHRGPAAGVHAALADAGPHVDGVVVAACDLPALDAAAVDALREAYRRAVDDLGRPPRVVVARSDRLQPAFALWTPAMVDPLEKALGGGGVALRDVVTAAGAVEVRVPAATLRNVNTPDDLP